MTLLTFCQDVADAIGIVRPPSIFGSADPTARRILQCSNDEGNALARAADWTILHREYTFETTAGTASYAVPDDWHRALGQTAWDRTNFRTLRGNMTPNEWQRFKSGIGATSSFRRNYRLVIGPQAGSIIIDPTPTSTGDDLVIEYVSKYWCEDENGNGQERFAADTDEVRIDHQLFRMGLLWRFKRSLGLDYADERADYDIALRDQVRAAVSMPVVNTAGPRPYRPGANTTDGSWNL